MIILFHRLIDIILCNLRQQHILLGRLLLRLSRNVLLICISRRTSGVGRLSVDKTSCSVSVDTSRSIVIVAIFLLSKIFQIPPDPNKSPPIPALRLNPEKKGNYSRNSFLAIDSSVPRNFERVNLPHILLPYPPGKPTIKPMFWGNSSLHGNARENSLQSRNSSQLFHKMIMRST